MESYFVISIDMGSRQTKMVVAAPDRSMPFGLNILDMEVQNSKGIRRGSVADAAEASKVVTNLILGAQKKISEKIPSSKSKKSNNSFKVYVCCNINGLNYFSKKIRVSCDLGGQAVTRKTIDQLKKIASDRLLDANEDHSVFRLAPMGYSLDNESEILDVLGKVANRIDVCYVGIVAKKANNRCVNSAFPTNSRPHSLYATPSAKAQVLLQQQQKMDGVVLVDLGAETTGVAVFRNGFLLSEVSIPFGSDTITRDVMTRFSLDYSDAELVKHRVGMLYANEPKMLSINLPGERTKSISGSEVAFCIRARVEEIAAYVFKAIEQPVGIRNIVITGGGAKLDGVCDVFSDVCGIKAINAETHQDIPDDVCQLYAGAIGMASIRIREQEEENASASVEQTLPIGESNPTPVAPQPVEPTPDVPQSPEPKGYTDPVGAPEPIAEPDSPTPAPEKAAQPGSSSVWGKFRDLCDIVKNAVTDDYNKVSSIDMK